MGAVLSEGLQFSAFLSCTTDVAIIPIIIRT